ncbi:Panacea domain-containing protein [Pyrodictium abyssi]|uniref:Panacea domain-containing protein n=1 Tax=Pyrodictium abyssi TaxID=54256 RepID=UPI0030C6C408
MLLYIVSRFPRGIGRTRLMKLLFLVDAVAAERLGRVVSGVEWRRWRYGPFSKEVLNVLDELVEEALLALDPGPEVRYVALAEPPELPGDVKEVVDYVVDRYGFMPLTELLKEVYDRYDIHGMAMGERIILDWRRELLELAEKADSDMDALVELMGRLYDAYRDALEALPGETLTLYNIAAVYLASRDPERLRKLTTTLLDVLDEVKKEISTGGKGGAVISAETRRRIAELYRELRRAAVEALEG